MATLPLQLTDVAFPTPQHSPIHNVSCHARRFRHLPPHTAMRVAHVVWGETLPRAVRLQASGEKLRCRCCPVVLESDGAFVLHIRSSDGFQSIGNSCLIVIERFPHGVRVTRVAECWTKYGENSDLSYGHLEHLSFIVGAKVMSEGFLRSFVEIRRSTAKVGIFIGAFALWSTLHLHWYDFTLLQSGQSHQIV